MVFGLSAAGRGVLPVVLAVVGVVVVCAATLTMLQRHRPHWVPVTLRSWDCILMPLGSWDWLPKWMRSLEPADRLITAAVAVVRRAFSSQVKKRSSTDSTTTQSALTGVTTAGHRRHDAGGHHACTSNAASLMSWLPLLKLHGDGESGYASVVTTPAPSRFASNALLQVIEDADNDDERLTRQPVSADSVVLCHNNL